MTLTKNAKRTATARTSGPHRTRTTRRSVHRLAATRPAIQDGLITVDDSLLTEVRDWTVLAGASLAAWLTAAIAVGAV
jgi:hypothetical protein